MIENQISQLEFLAVILMCFVVLAISGSNAKEIEPYKDPNRPIEDRVEDLLKQMTLEEKVDLVSGSEEGPMSKTKKNIRLGIPEIIITDGPLGPNHSGKATNYSASINMAATFDDSLIGKVAESIGEETRVLGFNMLLGPCINIARTPYGGRTFESFGEDPYLMSRMAVAYAKGVQSKHVITCTKHYACNNQEWNRFDVDVDVDERTLREIYLRAFKAVVQEADGWTIMAAYNQVLGHYCCENKYLLTDILKNDWGFTGVVVSDWGGIRSTVKTANSGLDLEMPNGKFLGEDLLKAVRNGEVKESTIDGQVRRILRVMFKAGLFDESVYSYGGFADTPERRALALEVARKSIVLLKNENNFLPLDKKKIQSIAVIGPNGDVARMYGDGSGKLDGHYGISPLQGIKNKVGDKITLQFSRGVALKRTKLPIIESSALILPNAKKGEHGLQGEYFNNRDLEGDPALTRIDKQVDFNWISNSPAPGVVQDEQFSVRWTGQLVAPGSGLYEIGVNADNGVRLFIDGKCVVDAWTDANPDELKSGYVDLKAGRKYDIKIHFYENRGWAMAILGMAPAANSNQEIKNAVKLAEQSDIVILCVGLEIQHEGEAKDRTELELPDEQIDLIKAVTAVNKNTIVVLNNATPILMNQWLDKVPAVVEALYPGQEGGNALADILFGDVCPSGKLPVTFPKRWEDSPVCRTYPGEKPVSHYTEGIYVGYRHFDKKNIAPLFPFGSGLSYTTFEYSDLEITPKSIGQNGTVTVHMNVKNTGEMSGDEVIQLYVQDLQSGIDREIKSLKGFKRVVLKPGGTKRVTFKLDRNSLAFYDVKTKQWVAEPGEFKVMIGSSSRDISLTGTFTLR